MARKAERKPEKRRVENTWTREVKPWLYMRNRRGGVRRAPTVPQVKRYVRQTFKEKSGRELVAALRVDAIAAHFDVERHTLERMYQKRRRKRNGNKTTLGSYIAERRIVEAARLLATTDMPVKRIWQHLGFIDHRSFNVTFLRCLHQSPRDWRKMWKIQ